MVILHSYVAVYQMVPSWLNMLGCSLTRFRLLSCDVINNRYADSYVLMSTNSSPVSTHECRQIVQSVLGKPSFWLNAMAFCWSKHVKNLHVCWLNVKFALLDSICLALKSQLLLMEFRMSGIIPLWQWSIPGLGALGVRELRSLGPWVPGSGSGLDLGERESPAGNSWRPFQ